MPVVSFATKITKGVLVACVVMIGLFGGSLYSSVTTTSAVGGLVTSILLLLVSLFTWRNFSLVAHDLEDGWNSAPDPARTFGDNGGTGSHDGVGETLPTWGTWGLQKWYACGASVRQLAC